MLTNVTNLDQGYDIDFNISVVSPSRGQKFLHSRVIDPVTKSPAVYEVTKIAKGEIYYRPIDGGKTERTGLASFSKVVHQTHQQFRRSSVQVGIPDINATVPKPDLASRNVITGRWEFNSQAGDLQILDALSRVEQLSSQSNPGAQKSSLDSFAQRAKEELDRRKIIRSQLLK